MQSRLFHLSYINIKLYHYRPENAIPLRDYLLDRKTKTYILIYVIKSLEFLFIIR